MKESIECIVVDAEQDTVKVRVKMHSDCSSCGICEGSNAVYYEAINKVNAKCGQSVILEIEKQSILKIAFMVFILPMIIIAASSIIGVCEARIMHISATLLAILLSLIALIPTFIYIRKYDAKVQGKSNTPIIIKILNE